MTKNDKISVLIAIIVSISGAFTTYFMKDINDSLAMQQAELSELRNLVIKQGETNKDDYEYVLKNYVKSSEYNADKAVIRADIRQIHASIQDRRR